MNRDQTNNKFNFLLVTYKKANSKLFLKTSADILFIWFLRKSLRQHSHKIQNGFLTFSLQFVPYFFHVRYHGGSLRSNWFVFYTIIDIIIRFDTITQ